jgi:hypothetical protein
MRITFSVDRELLARARKRAAVMGTPLNQLLRDHLEMLANSDDVERDMAELKRLSGKGDSGGIEIQP